MRKIIISDILVILTTLLMLLGNIVFAKPISKLTRIFLFSANKDAYLLKINDDLLDDPQSINSDPYGSWLAEFGDAERTAKLLTAQEYCKYLGKEAEMI